MCTDVVILAGGSGERLWPVSTEEKPKQFLRLSGGESFLQSAIARAWALNVSGSIYIITRDSWIDLVVQDIIDLSENAKIPGLLEKTVIMGEPFGKNTAPAAAWLARILVTNSKEKNGSVLLMASDHIIDPTEQFTADTETASWFADQDYLVSFAIPPRSPSTGYGYIQAGSNLTCPLEDPALAFGIDSFKEKPDEITAESYLDAGNYYWNSGLYLFTPTFYLDELKKNAPEVSDAFSKPINPTFRKVKGISVMEEDPIVLQAYTASPSISFDYAVSEKCDRSISVLARFDWDDVGSWDSLSQYLDPTPEFTGLSESSNTYVNSDIPVAICGVDDIIVVIRDGKALISKKGYTNSVKEALADLRNKDSK